MTFAHDTNDALQGAAALVNTLPQCSPGGEDDLTSVPALADYVASWMWTGRVDGDAAELTEVRALRPRLRELWLAAPDAARVAALVNELLRSGDAAPQLVTHGDYGWHIHATERDAPIAQRMQVEAAMAFVDVVRSDELDRIRICAADDCEGVVVDLSRNRSRRYCDSGCGNRLAAAAYRARQGD